MAAMTQTETQDGEALVVDQLVRITGTIGWFWITEIPADPNGTYILYGGTVGRNGVYAKTRYISRDHLEPITTPGKLRKAKQTRHAIAEALSAAPRVSQTRKPGKK
jgi:hypothetical protein